MLLFVRRDVIVLQHFPHVGSFELFVRKCPFADAMLVKPSHALHAVVPPDSPRM